MNASEVLRLALRDVLEKSYKSAGIVESSLPFERKVEIEEIRQHMKFLDEYSHAIFGVHIEDLEVDYEFLNPPVAELP